MMLYYNMLRPMVRTCQSPNWPAGQSSRYVWKKYVQSDGWLTVKFCLVWYSSTRVVLIDFYFLSARQAQLSNGESEIIPRNERYVHRKRLWRL